MPPNIGEDLTVAVPLVVVSGLMVWHLAEQRTKPVPGAAAPIEPAVAVLGKLGTVTVVATDPGPLPTMIQGMRFLKRGDGIGVVDQKQADEIVSALASVDDLGRHGHRRRRRLHDRPDQLRSRRPTRAQVILGSP